MTEFNRHQQAKDGRRPTCRECRNQERRSAYAQDPEPFKAAAKEYKSNLSDEQRKASNRKSALKTRYGLTPEEYDEMLKAQEGTCALCPAMIYSPGRPGNLAVDHDAETGRVRGLLCNQCNRGLGLLDHDPDRLIAAAMYLLKHEDVVGVR